MSYVPELTRPRAQPGDLHPKLFTQHEMPCHGNHPLQRIKGICPDDSGCRECLLRVQRGNLQPTYRLLIGIPGKSNAFAISKRLGLPDYIIDDARTHLESNDETFEDLLAHLEESRVTIEKEQEEIRAYKEEVSQLKSRLAQKEERFDERKDKMIRQANEEAQRSYGKQRKLPTRPSRISTNWQTPAALADS